MDSVQLASPTTKSGMGTSLKGSRVARDEQLRIPGRKPVPKPLPLRPARQAPAPPVSSFRLHEQDNSEDQNPRSPEVVDFDHGKEKKFLDPSKIHQDAKRLTDHSERTIDIIQYYLTSGTPNPPPTPAIEIRKNPIAAFDFGFPEKTNTVTPKATLPTTEHKPRVPSLDKALPAIPVPQERKSQQSSTDTTSRHKKAYSLYPAIQPTPTLDTLPRQSLDCKPSVQSPPTVAFATPGGPRKASIPSGIRTRADSAASLSPSVTIISTPLAGKLPRRPLTVRVRSESSSSSPSSASTVTPLRGTSGAWPSSRWSEDTASRSVSSPTSSSPPGRISESITSANPYNSVSGWTNSTVRESIEPLFPILPLQTTEQVKSFFEDDDDDDESRPLRWRWKRSSSRKSAGTSNNSTMLSKTWSPQSSFGSSVDADEMIKSRAKTGWKTVLCCCND